MEDRQPSPGELRVVTITAILEHGRTVCVDNVAATAASMAGQGVTLYRERTKENSSRRFCRHVSLLVTLPTRAKPVNVKVFPRKVQATGLRSDA